MLLVFLERKRSALTFSKADSGFFATDIDLVWPAGCSVPSEGTIAELVAADDEHWEALVRRRDSTETSWVCRVSGSVQDDPQRRCRPTRYAWVNALLVILDLELK